MDASKTLELFRSTMPPLRRMRRELAPSTEWHVRVELLGGTVVLSGQLDLVLGSGRADGAARATRLAIDLKTGRAWPEHAEDMRFYALLLAAAVRIPPYRVATAVPGVGRGGSAEDVDERVLTAPRTARSRRSAPPPPPRPDGRGAHARSVLHLVPALAHVSVERDARDRPERTIPPGVAASAGARLSSAEPATANGARMARMCTTSARSRRWARSRRACTPSSSGPNATAIRRTRSSDEVIDVPTLGPRRRARDGHGRRA